MTGGSTSPGLVLSRTGGQGDDPGDRAYPRNGTLVLDVPVGRGVWAGVRIPRQS